MLYRLLAVRRVGCIPAQASVRLSAGNLQKEMSFPKKVMLWFVGELGCYTYKASGIPCYRSNEIYKECSERKLEA